MGNAGDISASPRHQSGWHLGEKWRQRAEMATQVPTRKGVVMVAKRTRLLLLFPAKFPHPLAFLLSPACFYSG